MNELKSEISNILLLMVQEFRKNSEVNLMEYTRLLLSLPAMQEIIKNADEWDKHGGEMVYRTELKRDAERWRILKKHYWDRIGANADGLAERYSRYEKKCEEEK